MTDQSDDEAELAAALALSMGGTAALMQAHLADRVLSFGRAQPPCRPNKTRRMPACPNARLP